MPLYEPIIPARYASLLLDTLRAAPARVLRDALESAGIAEAALASATKTLTVAQFDALLTRLIHYSRRSDLGFELGLAVKLEDHPALGITLRRCATVDALLRLLVRYSRLVTPVFSLSYRRTAQRGEFIWRPAAYMSPQTLRVFEEAVAVSLHVELQTMLAERFKRCDLYLSMPSPAHRARYRQLHPTRYHFSSQALPEVKLVIGAGLLDLPLHQPEVHGNVAERELQTRQRKIARSTRWSEWVVMILREAEGCQPSRAQLAELLNVSEPTLVRHLAREGECLRELGKRIRFERACILLRDPGQSISQIAYRLGYGDVANFSHAFRAACDQSPSAHRAAFHPRD